MTKKFEIIEEGRLSNGEMGKVFGGADTACYEVCPVCFSTTPCVDFNVCQAEYWKCADTGTAYTYCRDWYEWSPVTVSIAATPVTPVAVAADRVVTATLR